MKLLRIGSFNLLLALTMVLSLASACSSDPGSEPATGDDSTAISIDHIFGTTTLDAVPTRIVSLDAPWTDTLLALGVQPVGYAVDAASPDGMAWQELSADSESFDTTEGLPYEQIAALDADLIVGSYSVIDEEVHRRLSEIAPTVARLDDSQVTAWEDLVTAGGALLDKTDEATILIDGLNARIDAIGEELPGLEGRTFALAQYLPGAGLVAVADEKDGSSVFFQRLGMTMLPALAEEGTKTGEARVSFSPERIELLRADLLAFLINGGDESALDDIPGFDKLPGTVAILDYDTIVALNTPSVLSVPHAAEKLKPYLAEAAEG
ncbi:MAG TPA: ABC transporter substrate-binding protein [Candidatus Avipropionibacterium avicola]|uniref:ABC transporter substrate-binding protein n=1 Tax=Candidatus Avipropionibacterium avicola TaxID=2840701 RepID=A0A9D1GXR9_9ACTN|nr:ABC transporter substrate-binding protein [Candidatus Avipropionibacterium avicola]